MKATLTKQLKKEIKIELKEAYKLYPHMIAEVYDDLKKYRWLDDLKYGTIRSIDSTCKSFDVRYAYLSLLK